MKKHKWEYLQESLEESISICKQCGLSYYVKPSEDILPDYASGSCPPWDSQGRGDIKAKRVYEVEVVQELKKIRADLFDYISEETTPGEVIKYGFNLIDQLIQKLEDQAGG